MARRMAGLGAALLLIFPQYVLALGLGSIELRSALNQPLTAEIALTSVTSEDLASLRVEIAPREAFARYGLDRTAFLDSVQFEIVTRPNGAHAILLTSREVAREPFLTFLLEARWARGRLLREYTVLLDPPTFMPEPVREAPVAAPRAAPAQPDERSGRVTRPGSAPAPGATTATPRSAPAMTGDGSYVVQRNDTLWELASRLRPEADITVNQMMLGLFEANPEAFAGNINRLRAGARLTVPEAAVLRRVGSGDATARVREQNTAWRAGLPAAAAPEPRLVLVAPADAPAATGSASAASGNGTALRAEAERSRSEAERLRSEAAALREERDEARRLLEIRDAELAALQQQLAGAQDRPLPSAQEPAPLPGVDLERTFIDDEEPAPVAARPAVAIPEAPAATPAAEPSRVVTTPAAPGLLDRLLSWLTMPLLWIGLGVLIVLAAVVLFLKRRRQDDAPVEHWELPTADDASGPADDSTQQLRVLAASAAPLAAGGTAAAVGVAAGGAVAVRADPVAADYGMQADEVADGDPIAEANFHMAYGLYDQAAELIDEAIADSPARSDLHLKLVEIHFIWGNQDGFIAAAKALKQRVGDGAEWDKTLIMARQLCPDEPLFAGETASGSLDVDFDGGDTGMFSLDFEVDEASQDAPAALDMQLDAENEVAAEEDFMLNIGMQTATNIEQGLLADDSPTVQQPAADAPTVETPTIESPRVDDETLAAYHGDNAETMESSALPDIASTIESPTLEQVKPRLRGVPEFDTEQTREIDLDDLGLDLEGLDLDLSEEDLEMTGVGSFALDDPYGDGSTRNPALSAEIYEEDDLRSRTGITQVLDPEDLSETAMIDDDEATRLAPALGMPPEYDDDLQGDATARVNVLRDGLPGEEEEIDSGATTRVVRMSVGDRDLNLDELSAALADAPTGDTVEHARPALNKWDDSFADDVFAGEDGEALLDLDIGELITDDDDPTGTALASEPETMTEIGTKLDLARAYIDMGDPDGARSILAEVLEEGDAAQQQEANKLLETLGD